MISAYKHHPINLSNNLGKLNKMYTYFVGKYV